MPNIIATSFVVEAMVDAQLESTNTLERVGDWIVNQMAAGSEFIRYVPDADILIHNANLLGARCLSRIRPEDPTIGVALSATLACQLPNGLWRYGEGPGLEWIDTFHTAYVLLALRDLARVHPSAEAALERGVMAWTEHCFDDNGHPLYYASRRGPLDLHSLATALYALIALTPTFPVCRRLAARTLERALALQRSDGAFVGKGVPYMRWNQGHMFLALAEGCRAC
jgi:hypothetical protein